MKIKRGFIHAPASNRWYRLTSISHFEVLKIKESFYIFGHKCGDLVDLCERFMCEQDADQALESIFDEMYK